VTHPPRASPLGDAPPVGAHHVKRKHRCPASGRRLGPRMCLRKGCGHKYLPRRWNQLYCQEPECLRLVRRWQAARRQAKHRQAAEAKARHAQAEHARRQQAKAAAQAAREPEVTSARGHAAEAFFPLPYAIGQAATYPPRPRCAIRLAIVALTAVRRFATFETVNASGSLAALWMAGRSEPSSTRLLADAGPCADPIPPH
jgi:hypothetical protein